MVGAFSIYETPKSSKHVNTIFQLDKRCFSLLLILIQSCGIRFFNGQGIVLAIVILALTFSGLKNIQKSDLKPLVSIAFLLFFIKLLNSSFTYSKLIFQYLIVLEAYSFLLLYKNPLQLQRDFHKVIRLTFLHAAMGFALFILVPSSFAHQEYSKVPYETFLNVFYVSSYQGAFRNSGIFWEPGLLQLMLNLFLFLSIKSKKHWLLLLMITATIFSTYSTVGFIILGLNYVYFLVKNYSNKRKFYSIILISGLITAPTAMIQRNLLDKFGGENTSTLVRYRDYLIGIDLMKEKPILGHGIFNSDYLTSKSNVSHIEQSVFSQGYLAVSEEMSGGYTNGLLGLFCWYGIPLGLIAYFLCFKNWIIGKEGLFARVIFFLILCLTFISEPITYTSFFLIFPFSYLIFNHRIHPRLKYLCV